MIGNQIPKPKFIREFRLGLVVYGGVSLAVYMNGVCREFYNAVRGRGVYKLIKALTDSDIVVDIISGTSAGGINGVLLSYALTNSSKDITFDFKDFSGVWRDSGDIGELLRKVNSADDVNSILDGEGYYQEQLSAAFQSVWKKQSKAPDDDWFSDFNELDLFVTGTDVLGKVSRQFDNTGKLIEVNDHHAVFILKHRKDRKTPFQPDNNQISQKALAKLCRITSCFPVAFPVVSVNLEEVDPQNSVDMKLVEWGNLNNRAKPKERP
jgi:patatin-related protein